MQLLRLKLLNSFSRDLSRFPTIRSLGVNFKYSLPDNLHIAFVHLQKFLEIRQAPDSKQKDSLVNISKDLMHTFWQLSIKLLIAHHCHQNYLSLSSV